LSRHARPYNVETADALIATAASTAGLSLWTHLDVNAIHRTPGVHAFRFFTRRILEWAHQGFLGRADRACYYWLGTHMDARREPDCHAILQVDHLVVITRVYRLLAVLYSLPRPCEHYPPVSHPTA
jgi:hypothetical protein